MLIEQLRGMDGQEQRVSVGFDLRTLVRVLGVFDRQIVKPELLLEFFE
jgi:cell division FtsZ-interacting protein ZapD